MFEKYFVMIILSIVFILFYSFNLSAAPYDVLLHARTTTHQESPFMIRGETEVIFSEMVNGKRQSETKKYRIAGYGCQGMETLLRFENQSTVSFLLKPEGMYIKETTWKPVELMEIFPKLISMGIVDQFFLLEILNNPRLDRFTDFISNGEDVIIKDETHQTVTVSVNRQEFNALAEWLTADVKELLGEAADGMSETQLGLLQRFAKGMLAGLDAEGSFTFAIQPSTGRIVQIDTVFDRVNPYGNAAVGARVKSTSSWVLYDFGEDIKGISINPQNAFLNVSNASSCV